MDYRGSREEAGDCLCGHMLSFLLGKYLGMELLENNPNVYQKVNGQINCDVHTIKYHSAIKTKNYCNSMDGAQLNHFTEQTQADTKQYILY